ncbi:MAG: TA system antitoxin ParD family protein [Planctomycetota bacterium]
MGQPVKLSDELVDDARAVVAFSQRSIAGQIEFWAALGKSIEPLLRGDRALALQMAGGDRPLSQLVSEVETAKGRKQLEATLKKRPYPYYKSVPDQPELVCRIEEDGGETIGRFAGRDFQILKDAT